jgi:hypothetical protein
LAANGYTGQASNDAIRQTSKQLITRQNLAYGISHGLPC